MGLFPLPACLLEACAKNPFTVNWVSDIGHWTLDMGADGQEGTNLSPCVRDKELVSFCAAEACVVTFELGENIFLVRYAAFNSRGGTPQLGKWQPPG